MHTHCINCGSDYKCSRYHIVEKEEGGIGVSSNQCLLCRRCALKRYVNGPRKPVKGAAVFNVPLTLYNEILDRLEHPLCPYKSASSLVSDLLSLYVRQNRAFRDLETFRGSLHEPKERFNLTVNADHYEAFKTLVRARGISYTEALQALLKIYLGEVSV